MSWRINFDGQVYREADLTIDEAERIEKLVGDTWVRISPYRSAGHARAILAVMVADRSGIPLDEATKKIGALRVAEFLGMVEDDEDDLPSEYTDGFPQPADGTSTDT